MPLVNCPECEKEISESARACPHCGFEETARGCSSKMPVYPCYYAKYIFAFAFVAILFFLLGKAVRSFI